MTFISRQSRCLIVTHFHCRDGNVSTDEEQQLLKRLKEITRVMKEGKILDGVSPEQEAEEAPYMEDWEGTLNTVTFAPKELTL